MKLKAELVPNERKYYGTEIKLTTEDGREAYFQVWINDISPDHAPSIREYDFKGEDGKYYEIVPELREAFEYEISDNHYETQTALDICNKIIEALDGMEL